MGGSRRQRAAGILATRILGALRGRPSALDPDHLFLSLRSARLPYSRACSPAGGLGSGCLGAGVQISPSKIHLSSPSKRGSTCF